MRTQTFNQRLHSNVSSGFALIATVSLILLLALVTIGMLSLSTIELRRSSQTQAMAEAQANARMALLIALGDLQKQVGDDRRATANASVLSGDSADVPQPHVMGVWSSTGEGRENGDDLNANNVVASYTAGRQSRFRGWLIPGEEAKNFNFPKSAAGADSIAFVGEGTLGANPEAADLVKMPLIKISKGGVETGAYSWWISGENEKARVNLYQKKASTIAGEAHESVAAPVFATTEIQGLETLAKDESVLRGITLDTLGLMGAGGAQLPDTAKKRFYDITVDSVGLLTSTHLGGFRKDLNLALEQSVLPVELEKKEIYSGGPIWNDLQRYYRSYKAPSDGGVVDWKNGVPYFSPGSTWAQYVSKREWQRYLPIPTKWQWVISHYSVASKNDKGEKVYQIRMIFDNILELWNPYNIPMTMPSDSHIDFKLWNIPYAMTYYVNGQKWEQTQKKKPLYWMVRDMPSHNQRQVHNAKLKLPVPLMAGEVRVYSDHAAAPQEARWVFDLEAGWELTGGLYSWTLGNGGGELKVPGTAEVEAVLESVAGFDPIWERDEHFTDIYFAGPNDYPTQFGYYKGIMTKGSLDLVAPSLPRSNDANFTAASIEGVGNKRPLAIMGMRMRTETRIEPSSESPISESEKALTKFYLFNDPWQIDNNVRDGNQTTMRHGNYEFFIQRVNSFNDYPFVEVTADNKGYMGTSRGARQPNNGQNHVPIREVPYLPMISMGQLQHAGLGHPSPDLAQTIPSNDPDAVVNYRSYPYVANAFGNSWAMPFIDAKKVEENAVAPHSGSMMLLHDKSWKANNALWDDWFFSSVSPQNQPIIASGDQKAMSTLLSEALQGKTSLPNSRYLLSQQRDAAAANTLATKLLQKDGYKKISSHMAINGAFNVNSTSVEAWKAFLASLDNRTLAYFSAETGEFKQDADQRYPVSRFTIPNGEAAKTEEFSSDQQEFLRKRWEGVRSLTEVEIEELATAMVEQVRLRGPFLSIGDFVNRRLASGEIGLHGALQAAINKTSINASFETTSQEVTAADVAAANYKNVEAALGKAGEGAPGYVTQADILMPLAPLIQVRSDTFRIRAYGEALNKDGTVAARAYCEAIVQRVPDFLDRSDPADADLWGAGNGTTNLLAAVNQTFGRRIQIKSFRWLSEKEI